MYVHSLHIYSIPTGEDRHDTFIELVSGYFDKGPKKSNKNVEIHICVVDKTGRVIEVCKFTCICYVQP